MCNMLSLLTYSSFAVDVSVAFDLNPGATWAITAPKPAFCWTSKHYRKWSHQFRVKRVRNINPKNFTLATRGTSREINRQIALTLIGTHQPVSRADLSRLMETNRANVTLLINELLEEGLVREGAQENQKVRGRKPTSLFLNSQNTVAVAVDVRASRTFIMVTDSLGKQIGEILSFPTKFEP